MDNLNFEFNKGQTTETNQYISVNLKTNTLSEMHKHQVDNIGFGMSLQEHSERAHKESLHHKQIDSRASPSAFSTAEDASDSAMFSMSAVSMRSGSGYDTRQVNAPSGFFAPTNTRVNSFK